ncbi:bromodomain-containing protein [Cardiosporidium cionae]|uniref:Bromodomain-containing protein n=1 Tax=Cardiosporidium cionae TaxID=476202 RepID=A0ABQ7J6D2_9APIC|nr:bromodomain-containing protein [Cardiosporidium cionae]|eukprot:KAF8819479.1 bromodomain-containing protein [Cardiosporidium cionae]
MELQSSSLSLAVLFEPIEKVRALLSKGVSENEVKDPTTNATILCWVAQRKNEDEAAEIARILVEEHNVNPYEKDNMQQNCLFYAAREGLTELSKYFVSKGCNPNEPDKVGQTPLFYAARDGRTSCLRELLELGGNPNQLDNNRQSCLFYAARDGRYDTVKVLLEYGANASLKDAQRRTALTFAKGNGHAGIVDLLKFVLVHSKSNSGNNLTSALASLPSFTSSSVTESGSSPAIANPLMFPGTTGTFVSPVSTRPESLSSTEGQVSGPNTTAVSLVATGTVLNESALNKESYSTSTNGWSPFGLVSSPPIQLKAENESVDSTSIRSIEAGKPQEGAGSCKDSISSKDSVSSGAPVSSPALTPFSFEQLEDESFHVNNRCGITNLTLSPLLSAMPPISVSDTLQNLHKRDASVLDVCPVRSALHRQKYRLQFHPLCEEHYLWMDAPLVKIEEFERRFPNLAIWSKDRPMAEPTGNADCFKREWRNAATTLMVNLSKYQGGHIFEKPVDPKKQHCPDYYDVISRPMSFSCIKGKLRRFDYDAPMDFLADVQLVFSNCALYNKEGSVVAITGKAMEQYFNNQLIVTKFSSFIERDKHIRRTLNLVAEANGQLNHADKIFSSDETKSFALPSEIPAKSLATGSLLAAGENPCSATASTTQSLPASIATAASAITEPPACAPTNSTNTAISDSPSFDVVMITGDVGVMESMAIPEDTISAPISADSTNSFFPFVLPESSTEPATATVSEVAVTCGPPVETDNGEQQASMLPAKRSETDESESAGCTDGNDKMCSAKHSERSSLQQTSPDMYPSVESSNFSSNGHTFSVLTNGTDSKEVDVK